MDKPKSTITLDRERTLKYDYNSLALAEKETGKNLLTDIASLKSLRVTDLRAMLWAGALHEDPELTVEAAGRLLKPSNTGAVVKAVAAGLNDFFGERS
jgi:hypothetical protein